MENWKKKSRSKTLLAKGGFMKTYTFYADLHIGSKYLELNILPQTKEQVENENAYDLGDSFDLKNCEPNNLNKLLQRWEKHQDLFSGRYVTGNHSCDQLHGPLDLVVDQSILLTHGDVLWDSAKRLKFRNEKMGQGSGLTQKLLSKFNGNLSKSEKDTLAQYVHNYGCSTVVIGHVHPAKLVDCFVGTIRVICCPRGKTSITI